MTQSENKKVEIDIHQNELVRKGVLSLENTEGLDISVVVPVYNGKATLNNLYQRIEETLSKAQFKFEVVFVDDGSSDDSWKAIKDLKGTFLNTVQGIKLARNVGQQAATYCGLLEARGKWVITMDDDLQFTPEEIPKLMEKAKITNADLVYGVHKSLKHNMFHNMGTRIFRWLIRHVAPKFPNGSSFRLIKREILLGLPENPGPGFYVDPILSWLTDNIVTEEVEHKRRKNGKSGYSFFKLLNLAFSLLIIYSTLPLKIMIWAGLTSSLVSFGIGTFYLFQKLTIGAAIGFSALIVTITFVSGVILMSLGIIGVYLAKIYTMESRQPAYTVQSKA